jgi:hypothetical protein
LCDGNGFSFALLEFFSLIEELLFLPAAAGDFHNHFAAEVTCDFQYEAIL